MTAGPPVEILMGTRDGAAHLPEMLASLLAQGRDDFVLRVRDDGSSDATWDILNDHRAAFGARLALDPDRAPSGSAKANFARLMAASTGATVLFADQDDVWTPDHVGTLADLTGGDGPVFAFSDLTVVDADLRPIADSYWAWKRTPPETCADPVRFALTNPTCGCATAVNRAAMDLALPMPPLDAIAMHDWWIGLLAAAAGRVAWTDRSTILYRQHGANASAVSQQRIGLAQVARARAARDHMRRGLATKARQAATVADRLDARGVAPGAAARLRRFPTALSKGPIGRRIALARAGFVYPDWPRRAGQFALC